MELYRANVLLIEDDEEDYMLVGDLLSRAPSARFDLDWIRNYDTGVEEICRRRHDVCLLDYFLGERTGLELLHELTRIGCETPVIFLTGQGGYEVDVEAMKAGASDYLVKGQISAELLERSIRYSIERKRAEMELRRHRDHLEELVRERTVELERTNGILQLEIMEHKLAEVERERLIAQLRGALAKVRLLSGLLPICSCCKKIRNDQGYWQQIEAYIRDHSEAEFSHGICPECAKKHYPEFFKKKE